MTRDAFRRLALSFPNTEQRAHMHHPDFRVGGKIFATLGYPGPGWAALMLSREEQQAFVAMQPDMFTPVKGTWGDQGATNLQLRKARAPVVRAALRAAYERRVACNRRDR